MRKILDYKVKTKYDSNQKIKKLKVVNYAHLFHFFLQIHKGYEGFVDAPPLFSFILPTFRKGIGGFWESPPIFQHFYGYLESHLLFSLIFTDLVVTYLIIC